MNQYDYTMKHRISITRVLGSISLCVLALSFASCSSPTQLMFADREWHISDYYGHIIDKDTTYRFSFGNGLIPQDQIIISSADSAAKYPCMERFIQNILHSTHLDNSEILFYAPEMQTMIVKQADISEKLKPISITSPMDDERPFTSWMHYDDVEDWTRKSCEMYTYSYFDKRNVQLLFVDCYNYGDIPIAQITVFQARNKVTDKMNITTEFRRPFYEYILTKRRLHVEALADHIAARRERAISNYKIGQNPKSVFTFK